MIYYAIASLIIALLLTRAYVKYSPDPGGWKSCLLAFFSYLLLWEVVIWVIVYNEFKSWKQ